jgi:protein-tyrosine kinase
LSIVEKAIEHIRKRREDELTRKDAAPAALHEAAPRRVAVAVSPAAPRAPSREVRVPYQSFIAQGILPDQANKSAVNGAIRRAKWPLLSQMRSETGPMQHRGRAWIVTSAIAGEGKTVTAINLALSLAQDRDLQVVLVDGDIPKSHVSRLFGCEDAKGLTDALTDTTLDPEDLLIGTDVPGFLLLPGGPHLHNVPELFGSDRMSEVLDRLLTSRPDRILLFDSPPVLLTNESQVLAKQMGQVILVIGADSTPRDAVTEAVGILRTERPVSCILNQVRRTPWIGYQLGYYGDYYEEQQEEKK